MSLTCCKVRIIFYILTKKCAKCGSLIFEFAYQFALVVIQNHILAFRLPKRTGVIQVDMPFRLVEARVVFVERNALRIGFCFGNKIAALLTPGDGQGIGLCFAIWI